MISLKMCLFFFIKKKDKKFKINKIKLKYNKKIVLEINERSMPTKITK